VIAHPNSAATGNISTLYTAAGTASCTLPSTLMATAMASVPLWTPISNALATACRCTTPRARGTKNPTARLARQNSRAGRPMSRT
jgi:hypothetical protein